MHPPLKPITSLSDRRRIEENRVRTMQQPLEQRVTELENEIFRLVEQVVDLHRQCEDNNRNIQRLIRVLIEHAPEIPAAAVPSTE